MEAASSAAALSAASTAPAGANKGQIYTWGFCTHGQLGLKETVLGAREYVEVPTHAGPGSVLRDVELRTAACGHFHTVAVDMRGNVFAFGRNDRCQLGRGCDDDSDDGEVAAGTGAVPRRLKGLRHCIIKDVACGAFHCLACTADGATYSWGWNKHGQLGRPTAYQTDSTPSAVREALYASPGPVKSFTAGFSHSAAVLWSGQVIVWGSNELGQLGVGSAVRHPEVAVTPLLVPDVAGRQVSAGDNHLLVLTLDGEVVAAGDPSYGRLGTGSESSDDDDHCHFTKVLALPFSEDPTKERMKAIAAGGATSAAVSTSGELYTWGGGVWGQLGHGDRSDRHIPAAVSGIRRVRYVDIAQDHMLATCLHSRTSRQSAEDADAIDDDASMSLSLWAWGRRQLLPNGVGAISAAMGDPEAQWVPAEVPAQMLGVLGGLQAKDAKVKLHAACGGSHSIVVGVPITKDKQGSKYQGVARCPRMTSVIGRGTKGGGVCETLGFKIISRNEEGRDEKVGGLRFCVWAKPISEIRPRRSVSSGEQPHHWDTHPFDLQFIIDRSDGTYDGSYVLRRPGQFFLHVHMLREGEDMSLQDQLDPARCGDPVSGSPFRIEIDSGPAFAPLCLVRLRPPPTARRGSLNATSSPKAAQRRRDSAEDGCSAMEDGEPSKPIFTVEASSEVVWEICSYDIFGNAVTTKKDRFLADITQQVSADAEDMETIASSSPKAGTESDLADSMGIPKVSSNGGSPAAAALRERVRQRKAERIWTMVSTQSLGFGAATKSPNQREGKVISLHVKQSSVPGIKEVRWTPNAVGRYSLSVALLPAAGSAGDGSPAEEPLGNSPFEVRVVPGRPSPSHSRLLVGNAATSFLPGRLQLNCKEGPVAFSSDDCPRADVPIRLVLCDRMGNICQESLDPLQFVSVRIENVSFTNLSATPPPRAIDSQVVPSGSKGSGLHTLQLQVSNSLLQVLAEASDAGELDSDTCRLSLFISANSNSKSSRQAQRLSGSPFRLELDIQASSWSHVLPSRRVSPNCSAIANEVEVAKAGLAAAVAQEVEGYPAKVGGESSNTQSATLATAAECELQARGVLHLSACADDSAASAAPAPDCSIGTESTAADDVAASVESTTASSTPANNSSSSSGVAAASVESKSVDAGAVGSELAQVVAGSLGTPVDDGAGAGDTRSRELSRSSPTGIRPASAARHEAAAACIRPASAARYEAAAACLATSVSAQVSSTPPERDSSISPLSLKLPLASMSLSTSALAKEEDARQVSSGEWGLLASEKDLSPPPLPRSPPLPSSAHSSHSSAVKTPPAAPAVQELQDRRTSSVQLPPIAAAVPTCVGEAAGSPAASSAASTTAPSSRAVDSVSITSSAEVTEGILPPRTASRGASRGTKSDNHTASSKSEAQQVASRQSGARLPLRRSADEQPNKRQQPAHAKAERKMLSLGAQASRNAGPGAANASRGSAAASDSPARQRRAARGGSVGLLFRDAPLVAPSPWPQAR